MHENSPLYRHWPNMDFDVFNCIQRDADVRNDCYGDRRHGEAEPKAPPSPVRAAVITHVPFRTINVQHIITVLTIQKKHCTPFDLYSFSNMKPKAIKCLERKII